MDVFVARQPIMNKKLEVVAYELLYRSGEANSFAPGMDGDRATSDVITNGLVLIGLDNIVGSKKAFVNFTEKLLLDKVPYLFSNKSLVVEILETIEPTEEVIKSCRELKSKGYIIALDDFVFHPRFEPLIELADIIKVDFLISGEAERKEIIKRVKNKRIKFLAEKVETREDFLQAVQLGYSYFQGYFFSKPVIVAGKDIPIMQINLMKLLNEIHSDEPEFDELAAIIERDLSISYKLLKYINQSGQYLMTRIMSIKHALMIIGLEELKKWLAVIIARGMTEGKPDVIIKTCMARASLCEKIAQLSGDKGRVTESFILGMFSMIDVLTDKPMQEALRSLPISDEIKKALLGEASVYRNLYTLVTAYEKGDWDLIRTASDKIGMQPEALPKIYLEALNWADQIYAVE